MKRFITAAVLSLALTTSAKAQSYFFERHHGQWSVVGIPRVDQLHPNCSMVTNWKNGARMMLINDLTDGELYLTYYNPNWNITDPPGKEGKLTIRFEDNSYWANYEYTFEVANSKAIRVRRLPAEQFVDMFAAATKMTIYMPGSIPNIGAGMSGTRSAMGSMASCIAAARRLNMIPSGPMSIEKPGIRM